MVSNTSYKRHFPAIAGSLCAFWSCPKRLFCYLRSLRLVYVDMERKLRIELDLYLKLFNLLIINNFFMLNNSHIRPSKSYVTPFCPPMSQQIIVLSWLPEYKNFFSGSHDKLLTFALKIFI